MSTYKNNKSLLSQKPKHGKLRHNQSLSSNSINDLQVGRTECRINNMKEKQQNSLQGHQHVKRDLLASLETKSERKMLLPKDLAISFIVTNKRSLNDSVVSQLVNYQKADHKKLGEELAKSSQKNTESKKHGFHKSIVIPKPINKQCLSAEQSPKNPRVQKFIGVPQDVQGLSKVTRKFDLHHIQELLQSMKRFVEHVSQGSEFIFESPNADATEESKNKFQLDQSISLNQLICDIDIIKDKSIQMKFDKSSSIIKPTEINSINEDFQLQTKLESEKRIQRYVSLFGSCKRTFDEVLKFIEEDRLRFKHCIEKRESRNDHHNIQLQNALSYSIVSINNSPFISSTHRAERQNGKSSIYSSPIHGNKRGRRTHDTKHEKSNGHSLMEEESKSVDVSDVESLSNGNKIDNGINKALHKRNSMEGIETEANLSDNQSLCDSIKLEDECIKPPRTLNYEGNTNIYYSRTDSRRREIPEEMHDFLDSNLRETNEGAIANHPYDRSFVVNKTKDYFIRSFKVQARKIKVSLRSGTSLDALKVKKGKKSNCIKMLDENEYAGPTLTINPKIDIASSCTSRAHLLQNLILNSETQKKSFIKASHSNMEPSKQKLQTSCESLINLNTHNIGKIESENSTPEKYPNSSQRKKSDSSTREPNAFKILNELPVNKKWENELELERHSATKKSINKSTLSQQESKENKADKQCLIF